MAYGKIDPKIEVAAREAIATARKDMIGVTESLRTVQVIHRGQISNLLALTDQHEISLTNALKALADLHNRVTELEEGVAPLS